MPGAAGGRASGGHPGGIRRRGETARREERQARQARQMTRRGGEIALYGAAMTGRRFPAANNGGRPGTAAGLHLHSYAWNHMEPYARIG